MTWWVSSFWIEGNGISCWFTRQRILRGRISIDASANRSERSRRLVSILGNAIAEGMVNHWHHKLSIIFSFLSTILWVLRVKLGLVRARQQVKAIKFAMGEKNFDIENDFHFTYACPFNVVNWSMFLSVNHPNGYFGPMFLQFALSRNSRPGFFFRLTHRGKGDRWWACR